MTFSTLRSLLRPRRGLAKRPARFSSKRHRTQIERLEERVVFAATFQPQEGSTTGWLAQIAGEGYSGDAIASAMDEMGNVYIAGNFYDRLDFDPGLDVAELSANRVDARGRPNHQLDAFPAKYRPDGSLSWVRQFGGDSNDSANSLAIDGTGVYISGDFNGKIDFTGDGVPDSDGGHQASDYDYFVLKLDLATGNTNRYSVLGPTGGDTPRLAVADGSVYVTGDFARTFDFDPGPGVFTLTPSGNQDVFVQKLHAATGEFETAWSFGGSSSRERVRGIVVNADGIYLQGIFNGTADFDPGPGSVIARVGAVTTSILRATAL